MPSLGQGEDNISSEDTNHSATMFSPILVVDRDIDRCQMSGILSQIGRAALAQPKLETA